MLFRLTVPCAPVLMKGMSTIDKRHLSDSACEGENESAGGERRKNVRFHGINKTKLVAILVSRVSLPFLCCTFA